MSAFDEIMELVKHPFADVKVFTAAQIVFMSVVIFAGILCYIAFNKTPINNATLTISAVVTIVIGLFLAAYSFVNKKMGKA